MSLSSESGNIIGFVAQKAGVAEAVLRLMVGLLSGKYHAIYQFVYFLVYSVRYLLRTWVLHRSLDFDYKVTYAKNYFMVEWLQGIDSARSFKINRLTARYSDFLDLSDLTRQITVGIEDSRACFSGIETGKLICI